MSRQTQEPKTVPEVPVVVPQEPSPEEVFADIISDAVKNGQAWQILPGGKGIRVDL